MELQTDQITRVVKEQGHLYNEMVRSIWGDRMAMAMTASTLAGLGMGLLFGKSWRTRAAGAACYMGAAGMQLYSIMSPARSADRTRAGETTGAERTGQTSATRPTAETRAA